MKNQQAWARVFNLPEGQLLAFVGEDSYGYPTLEVKIRPEGFNNVGFSIGFEQNDDAEKKAFSALEQMTHDRALEFMLNMLEAVGKNSA